LKTADFGIHKGIMRKMWYVVGCGWADLMTRLGKREGGDGRVSGDSDEPVQSNRGQIMEFCSVKIES